MRPLAAVSLAALGVATGLAGVAVHERWWGLPLLVAATVATLAGLPAGWWTRLPFALGLTAQVGWLVSPRPEGDYVVAGDPAGYALLGFALVVLVTGVATLPRPPRWSRREPPEQGAAAP